MQSWGIACQGKELFTRHGEYSVNLIRHGILNEPLKEDITGDLMRRPPAFCPGCPHRAVFSLLKQMNYHVAGDIGCYTLGALPPFEVIDDVVCMGAGISTLHGMEKAKGVYQRLGCSNWGFNFYAHRNKRSDKYGVQ